MSPRTVLLFFGVMLLACHAASDCPKYMRRKGEPFNAQRWAQMSACARGKHGQALVNYLNTHQNFFRLENTAMLRNGMLGLDAPSNFTFENQTKTLDDYDLAVPIPRVYDPRKDRKCGGVVRHITAQGMCADCWAHATAGVMSDRICKRTGGKQRPWISPYDLTSCCSECTDAGQKCSSGAWTWDAFKYISINGVVTESCKPVDSGMQNTTNPQCTATCKNPKQSAKKYYAGPFYALQHPQVIQREIMSKGSVVIDKMPLYEDFMLYKSGVYVPPIPAYKMPTHAVRLVGWGEQDGLPYWIAANSWGTAEQENGFFRVIRGINALGIEANAGAADPII